MTHPSEIIRTFSKVCFRRAVVFLAITMICSFAKSADTAQAGQIFEVGKFGAKGDGAANDTAAIANKHCEDVAVPGRLAKPEVVLVLEPEK